VANVAIRFVRVSVVLIGHGIANVAVPDNLKDSARVIVVDVFGLLRGSIEDLDVGRDIAWQCVLDKQAE